MDLRKKQRAVVDALEDIKARDIVVYDTAALPSMFERVVIASGDSTRQVKALADNVQEKLKAQGVRVVGVEGERASEWILVDFGDLVVHIMHPAVREFYNLEELWGTRKVRLGTRKVALRKETKIKKPAKRRGQAARPRRRR